MGFEAAGGSMTNARAMSIAVLQRSGAGRTQIYCLVGRPPVLLTVLMSRDLLLLNGENATTAYEYGRRIWSG